MMKRLIAVTAITTIALAAFGATNASAQAMDGKKPMPMHMAAPASHEATITGTVVDVSCKFGQGLGGADHKMCAGVCADKGLPLAVLGDDGKLYIPASASMPGDAQNGRLKPFAEQKVKISGKVFAAGGANAIQIATIEASK